MSRASQRIRVTGKRRDVIDTDRLAALLLRAALRGAADDANADSHAVGPAAPDDDADGVEGESAA